MSYFLGDAAESIPTRELVGVVIDENFKPLEGIAVAIVLDGRQITAVTDAAGQFTLSGVSLGPQIIHAVSKTGKATSLAIPAGSGRTPIQILLSSGAAPVQAIAVDPNAPIPAPKLPTNGWDRAASLLPRTAGGGVVAVVALTALIAGGWWLTKRKRA